MIIDFHVHLFARGHLPARWFDALARHLANRDGAGDPIDLAPKLPARIQDPEATWLMQDLDAAGIDAAVSLPLDFGVALGEPDVSIKEIVAHNAWLESRWPGRYISFTGIDPRRPDAPDFVRDTLGSLTLHGLNLYPMAGFDPSSTECLDVCRVCTEIGVPVMFHTGGANYPMRPRFGDPLLLGDVQAELPDLRFIIGHAGYPDQWRQAITVARRNPNAYLELSQWQGLAFRDPDRFLDILREMKREVGVRRILFGSDHLSGPRVSGPRSRLPQWVDWFRALPERCDDFSTEEVALILGANALELLNIDLPPALSR